MGHLKNLVPNRNRTKEKSTNHEFKRIDRKKWNAFRSIIDCLHRVTFSDPKNVFEFSANMHSHWYYGKWHRLAPRSKARLNIHLMSWTFFCNAIAFFIHRCRLNCCWRFFFALAFRVDSRRRWSNARRHDVCKTIRNTIFMEKCCKNVCRAMSCVWHDITEISSKSVPAQNIMPIFGVTCTQVHRSF